MADNLELPDVAADVNREDERGLERMGDFDEARCQPAPAEVRSEVDRTLQRAFPKPQG